MTVTILLLSSKMPSRSSKLTSGASRIEFSIAASSDTTILLAIPLSSSMSTMCR